MRKYVFMYNIDDESLDQEVYENKLKKAKIDFYINDINVNPIFDDKYNVIGYEKVITKEGCGLWVLEEHYLVAFTILNCEELLKTHWLNHDGLDVQDVLEWYDKRKDNELFVMYKGVKLVANN